MVLIVAISAPGVFIASLSKGALAGAASGLVCASLGHTAGSGVPLTRSQNVRSVRAAQQLGLLRRLA